MGHLFCCHAVELVVRHCHDGEDEIDEVEAAKKNVDNEESDVAWPGSHQGDLQRKTFFTEYHLQYNLFLQYRAYIIGQHLVKVLPEILGHDSEGS